MPTFKLTAKRDFGSGRKKVGKGSTIQMVSGSSTPGFTTTMITEVVNKQLGIDCIPASMVYFDYIRVG